MMNPFDIKAGTYRDEHGRQVTVVGPAPGRRYEVVYGCLPHLRSVLSGQTIQLLYPIAEATAA